MITVFCVYCVKFQVSDVSLGERIFPHLGPSGTSYLSEKDGCRVWWVT